MQRTEGLDQADVLKFWKMSLRHDELYKDIELEKGQTIRDKAEKELIECIETDGVFDEVLKKIFPGGLPKLLKTELKDLTITELQEVWKSEEGITVESWEKKHMAYVKLMIIYAVSHILGTIDFKRKKFLKEQIGKYVPADLKSIVSTCLKLLIKYLDDSTEPDPSKIKDNVRTRIDVVFPEGVLETGDPIEIKYYVVRKIAAALAIFGTSYDGSRLRNSYVKRGINKNSGDVHQALQATIITSCDYDEDGSMHACPEAYPLELQFPAALSPQERKDDDKKYNEIKLERLRRALGVNIGFFQYTNHLADLFIKEAKLAEENSGGTAQLSDKEQLGIKFIQILATDDPKTFILLKEKINENSKVYKQKFTKAFKTLEKYWIKKYRTFILNRFELITNIFKGHDGVTLNIINGFANRCLGEAIKDDCDYRSLNKNIQNMILAAEDLPEGQKVAGQRMTTICSEMHAYIETHQEVGSIQDLIRKGENGLERLLA